MKNAVLDAIIGRRTAVRFESTSVEEEKLETVLEAGRWAPSWLNKQPWSFIVVKDKNIKEKLSEVVPTVFVKGLREAPVCIAVVADTAVDQYHFVEAGAVATQNMALAAHSLGLHSCWIGIFDVKSQAKSSEGLVKEILGVPKTHRVISLLPIGYTRQENLKAERKTLDQIVYQNRFGNKA
ncbi:MAG: nitroreductase family protein [Candidatus Bathycorpusculaceae bacterium]